MMPHTKHTLERQPLMKEGQEHRAPKLPMAHVLLKAPPTAPINSHSPTHEAHAATTPLSGPAGELALQNSAPKRPNQLIQVVLDLSQFNFCC